MWLMVSEASIHGWLGSCCCLVERQNILAEAVMALGWIICHRERFQGFIKVYSSRCITQARTKVLICYRRFMVV